MADLTTSKDKTHKSENPANPNDFECSHIGFSYKKTMKIS
jgi:hypothetical protein